MDSKVDHFLSKVRLSHQALNIPDSFASDRNLPLHPEASELVEIKDNGNDKIHKLTPTAASAWVQMKDAAGSDDVSLLMVSGYRSVEYQRTLIEKKIQKGESVLQILTILAPPGFSEHHTGTAIDITTENCPPCVEWFENTDAFTWLQQNAGSFGFSLSYPRDNPYGFIYEPWHWAHHE